MNLQPLQPLTLPLRGVQLIEASAGTGKTWTIAALYLRLVLGHGTDTPLLPAQILVLTFTKAATAELRDRIRTRLADAARVFRGQGEPDAFLQGLLASYADEARAIAARRLELAAQWMDEAAIHTIHGWSQRMLVQHAFDSGHPFVQDTDTDESELLAEAVRDYWRIECLTLDRHAAAQLNQWWSTPSALQAEVRPLLRQASGQLRLRGAELPHIANIATLLQEPARELARVEAAARTLWRDDRVGIEASLAEALARGALNRQKYPDKSMAGRLAAMQAWADGGPIDAAILRYFGQSQLENSKNKQGVVPQHPAFEAIDVLMPCTEALSQLRPRVLAHAVPWLAARLDAAKRQRAQMGFDDMLSRLDAALDGAAGQRLSGTVSTQYPVALIDEFQDTDPLQWRIFHALYAHRPDHGLLLIGDPKQAIYGFRGADIHTYLQARDAASHPLWTLQTNYRSTRELVGAVNRVFAFADDHPDGAFGFGHGAHSLPFNPVEAQGRGETLVLDGRPCPALTFALLDPGQLVGSGAYLHQMAQHAAAWVVDVLDAAREGRCGFQRNGAPLQTLRPSDIAILVRKGSEAEAVRNALTQRGIKSVYLSDRDSVFAAPEALDLQLWLKACAEPGSDRAMRAALATAGLAASYGELDRLNTDEQHWEAMGERFQAFHRTWQRHGVLAMLHDFLHAFDVPARWLAREPGERSLTNLLHLAELLQQASTALDGEQALIRHLADQIADAQEGIVDTAEEQIVRLESEADLIKVITIHKSKGLEYPVVLLPFAAAPPREPGNHECSVWHDDDGRVHADLEPDDQARARADRERLQEDLRLLYVALTRPRHACWVGVAATRRGQAKQSILHRTALGHVLAGGRTLAADELMTQLRALQGQANDISIVSLPTDADARPLPSVHDPRSSWRPARAYAGSPEQPWWIASYSALRYHETIDALPTPAPETPTQDRLAESDALVAPTDAIAATGIHDFPAGAIPGTFLHDLLEWVADEGFATVARDPSLADEEIARRCERRDFAGHVQTLRDWLRDWLHAPLPVTDAPLSLGQLPPYPAYRAELEFWMPADQVDTVALDRLVSRHTLEGRPRVALLSDQLNGMLKGFIDLMFEHQGRFYVLDYKSNKLGTHAGAYTHDAMRDSILRERYDLQYALYTLALHRQLKARLPDYDYERHVGGVMYLYLRGVEGPARGVFADRLTRDLVEAMDALFAGTPEVTHVG